MPYNLHPTPCYLFQTQPCVDSPPRSHAFRDGVHTFPAAVHAVASCKIFWVAGPVPRVRQHGAILANFDSRNPVRAQSTGKFSPVKHSHVVTLARNMRRARQGCEPRTDAGHAPPIRLARME